MNIFKTKKQVVKIGKKYASRYKKWYDLDWNYIGINHTHSDFDNEFVLKDTKEEAEQKINNWFCKIEVIEKF